ncbi:E1 protein [Bos taurus papillomavirus 17]|uniref:Replication protein E1 n=1 Tax=Bos taurus papillomavirus 17 TaxID=1887215 RepID=A0A1B2K203_9PAPI|nr:E1 protein [Bos taurus papillomavirus 17]ANZ90240.1 E1 protein [Bos taurus papillomavirus 17]
MEHRGINAMDFIVTEAECDEDETDEEVCEESENSLLSDFVDNSSCEQGNSAELFAQQQANEAKQQIQALNRKYNKSARLPFTELSQNQERKPRSNIKRRKLNDSGYAEDNASEVAEVALSKTFENDTLGEDSGCLSSDKENISNQVVPSQSVDIELLKAKNDKAVKLARFKEEFQFSFTDLTRPFNSDKTCCPHWVAVVNGGHDDLLEASKTWLQKGCTYVYQNQRITKHGFLTLYLLAFKSSKNRETVRKLFCKMLNLPPECLMLQPPIIRSVPASVFWWKSGMCSSCFTWGEMPDWIAKNTLITHVQAQEQTFDLGKMIQWAYDNDYTEECIIAYKYAQLADEDLNAQAWLRTNTQAKFVKECAIMAKYYKRAEMREMTMSDWIHKALTKVEGEGDWKQIVQFIRFQGIHFVHFLTAFKDFLHSKPKHNCIVIYGPPNTGKSMFAMGLMQALQGKVISFVNHKSHFWLQPLGEAKLAVLDDATHPTWNYFDTYLRNGLDGNWVSLDSKHKAPSQLKFPPLMITTNIDITADDKFFYLKSRVKCFEFPNSFPLTEDGSPGFDLSNVSWKFFFRKFWTQLELTDPAEEPEDDQSARPFRCCAERTDGHL